MRRRRLAVATTAAAAFAAVGHATVDDVADVADAVATIYKTRFALGVCLAFAALVLLLLLVLLLHLLTINCALV